MFLALGAISNEVYYKWVEVKQPFNIDDKIDIVELASLVFTVFLTIYVSKILDSKKQNSRVEKDIVIGKLNDCIAFIEKFSLDIRGGTIGYNDAVSMLAMLGAKLRQAFAYIDIANVDVLLDKSTISAQVRILRSLITNTPTTQEVADAIRLQQELPLTLINGVITISSSRRSDIMREERKLETLLFESIVDVNRSTH